MMTSKEALAVAVGKVGNYARTAAALGLKTSWAVQKWEEVPAEHVLRLANLCGYAVTPHQLRPDLYPHPDDGMRGTVPAAAIAVPPTTEPEREAA